MTWFNVIAKRSSSQKFCLVYSKYSKVLRPRRNKIPRKTKSNPPGVTDMGSVSLSRFLVKPYEMEAFVLATSQEQLVYIWYCNMTLIFVDTLVKNKGYIFLPIFLLIKHPDCYLFTYIQIYTCTIKHKLPYNRNTSLNYTTKDNLISSWNKCN